MTVAALINLFEGLRASPAVVPERTIDCQADVQGLISDFNALGHTTPSDMTSTPASRLLTTSTGQSQSATKPEAQLPVLTSATATAPISAPTPAPVRSTATKIPEPSNAAFCTYKRSARYSPRKRCLTLEQCAWNAYPRPMPNIPALKHRTGSPSAPLTPAPAPALAAIPTAAPTRQSHYSDHSKSFAALRARLNRVGSKLLDFYDEAWWHHRVATSKARRSQAQLTLAKNRPTRP